MSFQEFPPIKRQTIEQFDGSKWRHYQSPESLIILTALGRELFAKRSPSKLLSAYASDWRAGREGDDDDTRRFLTEGTKARVFSVNGASLAIKEALPDSDPLMSSLYRMDRLQHAVQGHTPHWLGVPSHYGLLMSKRNPNQQFLLMEQIDAGVTVGDVLTYPQLPENRAHMTDSVRQIFGDITPQFQDDISTRFETIKNTLRQALIAEYMSPDEYLPDIDHNPYNVLIEPVSAPIAGSVHKFWVIDQ